MRVRFGNEVKLCVSVKQNSTLLIITTIQNEVYKVDCENVFHASELLQILLEKGYLDLSGMYILGKKGFYVNTI